MRNSRTIKRVALANASFHFFTSFYHVYADAYIDTGSTRAYRSPQGGVNTPCLLVAGVYQWRSFIQCPYEAALLHRQGSLYDRIQVHRTAANPFGTSH